MSDSALLLLALGLAMDAAAVAAARGLATPAVGARHVLLIAGFFGGFQGIMPVFGWLLGSRLGPLIAAYHHWVAFLVLLVLGIKMIFGDQESEAKGDPYALRTLTLLAVATSIDAFAVGITLPMLGVPLLRAALTIGIVTAVLSGAALAAGRSLGAMAGRRLDALGGLVLVGLGVKILIDGLRATKP